MVWIRFFFALATPCFRAKTDGQTAQIANGRRPGGEEKKPFIRRERRVSLGVKNYFRRTSVCGENVKVFEIPPKKKRIFAPVPYPWRRRWWRRRKKIPPCRNASLAKPKYPNHHPIPPPNPRIRKRVCYFFLDFSHIQVFFFFPFWPQKTRTATIQQHLTHTSVSRKNRNMAPGKKGGGDRIFISASAAAEAKIEKKCWGRLCCGKPASRKRLKIRFGARNFPWKKGRPRPNGVFPLFSFVTVHDFTQKKKKKYGKFFPLFFSLHFPLLWSKTSVWVSSIG